MFRLGVYEIRAPAVCASIIGSEISSMRNSLRKAADEADIVELRLDKLQPPSEWRGLLRGGLPTIVTNRPKWEGGYFEGSEEERIDLLLDAADSGVSCVDIELSASEEMKNRIFEAVKEETSVIVSFHDFQKVPPIPELMERVRDIVETGGDYAKIIGFARDREDSLRVLDFLIKATEEFEIPVIAFAMGESGRFTRLAAPLLGSLITYAAVGEEAAPGQIDLSTVKGVLEKFEN